MTWLGRSSSRQYTYFWLGGKSIYRALILNGRQLMLGAYLNPLGSFSELIAVSLTTTRLKLKNPSNLLLGFCLSSN